MGRGTTSLGGASLVRQRQIDSLPFAPVLKSRDKAGRLDLATRGQVINNPADVAPPELLSLALEPLASDRALIRIEADEAVRLEVRYGAGGLEWTAVQPSFSPSPSLLLAGLDATGAAQAQAITFRPSGATTLLRARREASMRNPRL